MLALALIASFVAGAFFAKLFLEAEIKRLRGERFNPDDIGDTRVRCTAWSTCQAFGWHACVDGRCKYHCELYCKCVPRGIPGSIRVIDGGKK